MDRDDGSAPGGLAWDAAFEAVIAQLRPPRYVRVARTAWHVTATLLLLALACWTVLRVIGEPLRQLGRPWI
ncbi:MAG TPA: hypothetical protein VF015_04595 [Acidimicrobiales bacterium]